MSRKRLKTAVLAGSSRLTLFKRAHRRVETPFLICPLLFGKPSTNLINYKR